LFLRGAGARQRAIAMRESAESADHVPVRFGVLQIIRVAERRAE
jgi:hypothetical protein